MESWCVKFLLPYVHNKLLLYRQRKQWLNKDGKLPRWRIVFYLILTHIFYLPVLDATLPLLEGSLTCSERTECSTQALCCASWWHEQVVLLLGWQCKSFLSCHIGRLRGKWVIPISVYRRKYALRQKGSYGDVWIWSRKEVQCFLVLGVPGIMCPNTLVIVKLYSFFPSFVTVVLFFNLFYLREKYFSMYCLFWMCGGFFLKIFF